MGPAMKPMLIYEDRVLVKKSRKYIPERGDVVAFKSPDNPKVPFIMRVAALPGEIIQMEDGMLYIDSQEVDWGKTEFHDYGTGGYGIEGAYEVPKDCYFVLGDNIANSEDSRVFGAIHKSDLIGEAYKIYWPLSRRGPIE
jgi:signal peptidase I